MSSRSFLLALRRYLALLSTNFLAVVCVVSARRKRIVRHARWLRKPLSLTGVLSSGNPLPSLTTFGVLFVLLTLLSYVFLLRLLAILARIAKIVQIGDYKLHFQYSGNLLLNSSRNLFFDSQPPHL